MNNGFGHLYAKYVGTCICQKGTVLRAIAGAKTVFKGEKWDGNGIKRKRGQEFWLHKPRLIPKINAIEPLFQSTNLAQRF